MTRVGIMTFLHNDNYGSILQAYALQRAVRSLGYDAEDIDYAPCKVEKLRNLLTSGNSPRLILDGMRKRSAARGLNEGFSEFRKAHLALSPVCSSTKALATQARQYDVLVCGSDQIWSPTWLNPAYFLHFSNLPKVAYAPSLGVSSLSASTKRKKLLALTKGFSAISVREEEGAALLENITGQTPLVMPDPVMLLTREEWFDLLGGNVAPRHELVCFFLADNPAYWAQVKRLHEETGLPVRVIPRTEGALQCGYPLEKGVSPMQWLRLLAGAEMVMTDSFHAATFSLMLHTPCQILRRYRDDDPDSKNSRIDQLLRTFGISDPVHPDFAVLDDHLAQHRARGLQYLADSLGACT